MTLQDQTQIVADIVAAYVARNPLPSAELVKLIATVHTAIGEVVTGKTAPEPKAAPVPAVPVKKSIGQDFIICLEDGRKLKSLKRYLSTRYGLTPDQYRERWGLSRDYPMVCPSYSKTRADLARKLGLGKTPTGRNTAKSKAA